MSDDLIFSKETKIIQLSKDFLTEAAISDQASTAFSQLLDAYKRLFRQTKKLIKQNDRQEQMLFDKTKELADLVQSLEDKVAERTAELQHQTDAAILAKEHAVRAEKAATIAQLNAEVARDESDRLRKHAEAASRLKGEIIANMSHEFNSPLNAIINVPSLVVKKVKESVYWECHECHECFEDDQADPHTPQTDTEQCPNCQQPMERRIFASISHTKAISKLLRSAITAGEYLKYCIDNIMKLNQLESGNLELSTRPVEVEELLEEVRSLFTHDADVQKVSFTVVASNDCPRVKADPHQLTAILSYLVDNAIRFTDEGGAVRLAAMGAGDGAHIHFSVSDTGVGIPTEAQPIVFESFRQAESGHTRSYLGLGLGLTLAAKLVGLHGSRLMLDSEVSRGTTVSFDLHKAARQEPG